ncbi:hypothetical protein GmRootV116_01210 [Variovorax sp. V116]
MNLHWSSFESSIPSLTSSGTWNSGCSWKLWCIGVILWVEKLPGSSVHTRYVVSEAPTEFMLVTHIAPSRSLLGAFSLKQGQGKVREQK